MRSVDHLGAFPFLGHVSDEYRLDQIRELIVGDYHVLYWVSASQVEILGVYHGRQSPFQD
jgi:plasmid stabilization system protein ParE